MDRRTRAILPCLAIHLWMPPDTGTRVGWPRNWRTSTSTVSSAARSDVLWTPPHRWAEFSLSPARFLGRDPVEYRDTVISAFTELIEHGRGTHVAVVSHGMTINTVLRAVVGAPGERNGLFAIGHCSVTRLSGSSLSRMRVDSVNESVCRPIRGRSALPNRPTAPTDCCERRSGTASIRR